MKNIEDYKLAVSEKAVLAMLQHFGPIVVPLKLNLYAPRWRELEYLDASSQLKEKREVDKYHKKFIENEIRNREQSMFESGIKVPQLKYADELDLRELKNLGLTTYEEMVEMEGQYTQPIAQGVWKLTREGKYVAKFWLDFFKL